MVPPAFTASLRRRAALHAHDGTDAMRLLDGGDHALSDFEQHLPFVLSFLGLDAPA